ncbi:hypothetical protein FNF31_07640 [Cafeteria roenbergensis]|uniref:Uncharacterized protein n=1 Tax=Cafeteria roenbergensis TaxID=33653 RepID=A0A5A8C335_CAFRO|nr:hypothetical protein FNF31_07640 [Cafeteria roenbergensis]
MRLLREGADINWQGDGHGTALIWVVWNRELSMLKLLLDNGADTEVKDGSGRTALSHAAVSGRPDVAACLLDRGADLEAMDNGRGVKDFVQHEACRSVLDEEAECLQRWHRRRTLVLWRQ